MSPPAISGSYEFGNADTNTKLCFGQDILLYFPDGNGFLTAQPEYRPQLALRAQRLGTDMPPSYHSCRFRIFQKFQYTERRALEYECNTLAVPDSLQQRILDNVLTPVSQVLEKVETPIPNRARIASALSRLQRNCAREVHVNEQELQRLVGQPVLHGQVIQLMEVSSGKFLTIRRTASETSTGCLSCTLLDGGDTLSWFSISSAYGTKQEGDNVLLGELVKLSSINIQGLGLSVLSETLPPRLMPGVVHSYIEHLHEFAASDAPSAFKLLPCSCQPVSEQEARKREQLLHGTGAVTVYHRASSSLLLSDGARVYATVVGESEQGDAAPALAVWRVVPRECGLETWPAMPLATETGVLLCHLVSGKFLCLGQTSSMSVSGANNAQEGLALTVTDDYQRPECVFEFSTVDASTGEKFLRTSEFAFLGSGASWYSAEVEEAQTQYSDNNDAGARGTLVTGTVTMSTRRLDSNVISLTQLSPSVADKISELKKCLGPVESFVRMANTAMSQCSVGAVSLSDAMAPGRQSEIQAILDHRDGDLVGMFDVHVPRMTKLLTTVCAMLRESHEEEDLNLSKRLIRDTGLLAKTCEALGAFPFTWFLISESIGTPRKNKAAVALARLIHTFIALACAGCETNQTLVLANWLPQILSHICDRVQAAETVATLYKGLSTQICEVQTHENVKLAVRRIQLHGRNPHYANMLCFMSGCEERPLPTNQHKIMDALLASACDVLVHADLRPCPQDPASCTVVISFWDTERVGEVDCARFASAPEERQHAEVFGWYKGEVGTPRWLFLYYVHLLHCFVTLVNGRNMHVKQALLEASKEHGLALEADALLRIVESRSLPPCLQSVCMQLYTKLYIDTDANRPLLLPRCTRLLWADSQQLTPASAAPSETAASPPSRGKQVKLWSSKSVPEVVQCLLHVAESRTFGQRFELGLNCSQAHLLWRVVHAIRLLANYGLISVRDEVYGEILHSLRRIMPGVTARLAAGGRADASTMRSIVRVKTDIAAFFSFTMTAWLDLTLSRCLDAFGAALRKYMTSQSPHWAQLGSVASEGASDTTSGRGMTGIESEEPPLTPGLKRNQIVPAQGAQDQLQRQATELRREQQADIEQAAQIAMRHVEDACTLHGFDMFTMDANFDPQHYHHTFAHTLLQLFVHNDGGLSTLAAELLDMLLAHKRRLVIMMLRTHILFDEDTMSLYRHAQKLLYRAHDRFRYMNLPDEAEKEAVTQEVCDIVREVRKLLTPLQRVSFEADRSGHPRCIIITKAIAQNFQIVFADLRAHVTAMQYLNAPINWTWCTRICLYRTGDASRTELLNEWLLFLGAFCSLPSSAKAGTKVTAQSASAAVTNADNQLTVFQSLDHIVPLLGMQGLDAATAICGIISQNEVLARKVGREVIQKVVTLLLQRGAANRTSFLQLLSSVVLVGNTPIKANAQLVLKLLDKHRDALCEWYDISCPPREVLAERQRKIELMKAYKEDEGAAARLDYHRALLQLVADCARFADPTLAVQSASFVIFENVVNSILAAYNDDVDPEITRHLVTSYWSFLQIVYFSANTDVASSQIRQGENNIWVSSASARLVAAVSEDSRPTATDTDTAFKVMSMALSKGPEGVAEVNDDVFRKVLSRKNRSVTKKSRYSMADSSFKGVAEAWDDERLSAPDVVICARHSADPLSDEPHQPSPQQVPTDAHTDAANVTVENRILTSMPAAEQSASVPDASTQAHSAPGSDPSTADQEIFQSRAMPGGVACGTSSTDLTPDDEATLAPPSDALGSNAKVSFAVTPRQSLWNQPSVRFKEPAELAMLVGLPSESSASEGVPTQLSNDVMTAASSNAVAGRRFSGQHSAYYSFTERVVTSVGLCNLMDVVVGETNAALQEPVDALQNPLSVLSHLCERVVPAITPYFKHHYAQHVHDLPAQHEEALLELATALRALRRCLADMNAANIGVGSERRRGMHRIGELLAVMTQVAEPLRQVSPDSDDEGAPSSTQMSASTLVRNNSEVHDLWKRFITAFGGIGLIVMKPDGRVSQLSTLDSERDIDGKPIDYIGIFRLSRLLSNPWGTEIPGKYVGTVKQFTMESALAAYIGVFLGNGKLSAQWAEEQQFRLAFTVRATLCVDDGRGSDMWRRTWTQFLSWQPLSGAQIDREALVWAQNKFDRLGATAMCVAMICSLHASVRLEATHLLVALLEGGNRTVQQTLHDLLIHDTGTACRFFDCLRDTIHRSTQNMKRLFRFARTACQTSGDKAQGPGSPSVKALGDPLAAAGASAGVGTRAAVPAGPAPQKGATGARKDSAVTWTTAATGTAAPQGLAKGFSLMGRKRKASFATKLTDAKYVAEGRVMEATHSDLGVKRSTETGSEREERVSNETEATQEAHRQSWSTLHAASVPEEFDQSQEADDEVDEDAFRSTKVVLNHCYEPLFVMTETFRLLQLMVEGHFKPLQEMLGSQKHLATSIDFLQVAVDLLATGHTFLRRSIEQGETSVRKLMLQVIAFLQEMVQGPCEANQEAAVVRTQVLLLCNRIISMEYSSEGMKPEWMIAISEIKTGLLCLLMNLLERSPRGGKIGKRMLNMLDFRALQEQLLVLFRLLQPDTAFEAMVASGTFGALAISSIRIETAIDTVTESAAVMKTLHEELTTLLRFLRTLMANLGSATVAKVPMLASIEHAAALNVLSANEMHEAHPYEALVGRYLAERVGFVEVVWDGVLERVFFPITPECRAALSSHTWRTSAQATLRKAAPNTRNVHTLKALDLLSAMVEIRDHITCEHALEQSGGFFIWTARNRRFCENIAIAAASMTLIITFFNYGQSYSEFRHSHASQFWSVKVTNCISLLAVAVRLVGVATGEWPMFMRRHGAQMRGTLEDWVRWVARVRAQSAAHIAACITAVQTGFIRGTSRASMRRRSSQFLKGLRSGSETGRQLASVLRSERHISLRGSSEDGNAMTAAALSRNTSATHLKWGVPQCTLRAGAAIPSPPEKESDKAESKLPVRLYGLIVFPKFSLVLLFLLGNLMALWKSPFLNLVNFGFVFSDWETGRMLFEALSLSGNGLLRTSLLAVITILVFAIGTFITFVENTDYEALGHEPICKTLYGCVGMHFLAGTVGQGNIGHIFNDAAGVLFVSDEPFEMGRSQALAFWVFAFYMIWTFVLSNIFIGQIVDAFSALRSSTEAIHEDSERCCLICSVDRITFQQDAEIEFEAHVAHEHNVLQYVYFLHFLSKKNPEEHSGVESWVFEVLQSPGQRRINWIPIGTAIALEATQERRQQEAQKLVNGQLKIQNALQRVTAALQEVLAPANARASREKSGAASWSKLADATSELTVLSTMRAAPRKDPEEHVLRDLLARLMQQPQQRSNDAAQGLTNDTSSSKQ